MTRITICLSLLLCCTTSVLAQQPPKAIMVSVPRLMRYSGAVIDSADKGVVGITFSLYKQQQGGAALWMETQNARLGPGGHYSVMLGASKLEGLPLDLFTSGEARWLGVQVEGQPEQPRVLLVSVPYALKAHEAEKLAGKSVSEFVLSKQLNEQVRTQVRAQMKQASGTKSPTKSSSPTAATPAGATDFSATTADQVVSVTQLGTGVAISASAPANNGIVSQTGSATGIGVYGKATSTSAGLSYGLRGDAVGPNGRGIRGVATGSAGVGIHGSAFGASGVALLGEGRSTTGTPTGVYGTVFSANGTAGRFDNLAGGKILSLRNNGVEKLTVDGGGNLTGGTLQGTGASTGVSGMTDSGSGVFGQATSTTSNGSTFGVQGLASVPGGFGVYGSNNAASGGVGVQGTDTNTTGIGVVGLGGCCSNLTSGGIGVLGMIGFFGPSFPAAPTAVLADSTHSPNGIGMYARSSGSGGAVAGVFENNGVLAGKLLSGRTHDSLNTPVETFSVAANGKLQTNTTGANNAAVFIKDALPASSSTLAALEVHNSGANGEVAWLGHTVNTNTNPVVKLVLPSTSTADFLKCHRPDLTQKCHIDSNGTFHSGSDFAEALPARGARKLYEPGDVLVMTNDGTGVEKTNEKYSRRIIGVYSTRPAVLGAEKGGVTRVDPDDVPVAITGIVPTKVTAQNGSILVGDLLVTSPLPGYAMRGSNRKHMTGATVGKALDPLRSGTGVIRVLVTLQ